MKYTKQQMKEFRAFVEETDWYEYERGAISEEQMDCINGSLVFALWRIGNALKDLKRAIIKNTRL